MTDADTVVVLGVRHHGPGSARSVERALEEVQPAAVVIEGPPELDSIVSLAADPAISPPVAGLVYDVAAPRRASFYPLADFSPEWIALQWALRHRARVQFADLRAAHRLAPPAADGAEEAVAPDHDPDGLDLDPIGALAEAAGYDDAERWWEDAIEQRAAASGAIERFATVTDAMRAFRRDEAVQVGRRDRLAEREASMRTILRRVVEETDGPVAVVCGAYHAPVLHPDDWPSANSDSALLRGLAKTKVAATWAPWTSARLAFRSGYGAGVQAPRWYEHLFTHDDDVVSAWMVRAARLLRGEGYDASAASAVEATRLAEALAALRGRPIAGLAEVNDAVLTVLGQGSTIALNSISERLLVGSTLGTVPESTPLVPLAEDLARQQRSLRIKPSAEQKTITIDLRKPSQLARSVLFRRLLLLDVPWAQQVAAATTGTFKEAWQVEWQPELSVAVIEASLYGTTIEAAATARVVERGDRAGSLTELAELVDGCLLAELPDALDATLATLAERTAHAHDQLALMQAVEPLARTRRYGNVRGVDTAVVGEVLATMVTRAAIGLATACASLDDDAAAAMRVAIGAVERGVSLVEDRALAETWRDALAGLSPSVHGSVGGSVSRILLDAGRIEPDEASERLSRALSLAASPGMAASWLDGFLAGDVALLLYDPRAFGLVDDWLCGLDEATFDDLLPLVRRTFARFRPGERRQIGDLVNRALGAGGLVGRRDEELDLERAGPAIAKMAELLGIAEPMP